MITVLLVDDRDLILKGVRYLLETAPDIEVVAIALDESELITQTRHLHPDVVVLDIFMPNIDGMEITRTIRECCPRTRVLALSYFDTPEHVRRALQAGAEAYILKEHIQEDLLEAIRFLYSGSPYFSRKVAAIANQYMEDRNE